MRHAEGEERNDSEMKEVGEAMVKMEKDRSREKKGRDEVLEMRNGLRNDDERCGTRNDEEGR